MHPSVALSTPLAGPSSALVCWPASNTRARRPPLWVRECGIRRGVIYRWIEVHVGSYRSALTSDI